MIDGFTLQTLAPNHQRERFCCRSESLNSFIRNFAKNQHRNSTTRVHVYANDDGVIAGYFTLSAHMIIDLTALPEAILKGRPRLPIPATLLGRFAVDKDYEGHGVGRFLLGNALREAHRASETVASALVVLDLAEDASESAPHLYLSVGFSPLPSNRQRLLLPMDVITQSL